LGSMLPISSSACCSLSTSSYEDSGAIEAEDNVNRPGGEVDRQRGAPLASCGDETHRVVRGVDGKRAKGKCVTKGEKLEGLITQLVGRLAKEKL
jgi:hypothetical protein